MANEKEKERKEKIILDPIYGIIRLDPLAVRIIDTHYFQRLRYIKQLHFGDFVYPGATHTRFAHSIGVYHLASEMIKILEDQNHKKDGKLFDETETNCIRVAALCHDLGHGPFSHAYEDMGKEELQGLKHEAISVFLVDKMFRDTKYGLTEKGVNVDIELIKDLIQGNYDKYKSTDKRMKKYMFQIVANKESGMDVDKWDYFNRDAIACGVPERFQFDRALHVARVVKTNEGYELGYRDFDAFSLYSMFNTRFTLYRKVYRHKVLVAVELMVKDVFRLVNDANKDLPESDIRLKIDLFPIKELNDETEQHNNLRLGKNTGPNNDNTFLMIEDYLNLRDDVLLKIHDSSVDRYQNARKIIRRLEERKLYRLFHEFKVDNQDQAREKADEIQRYLNDKLKMKNLEYDVEIKIEKFDYGSEKDDPIEKVHFYSKGNIDKPDNLERNWVSFVLPNVFQEYFVRVYEKFSGNGDYDDAKKSHLTEDLNNIMAADSVDYDDLNGDTDFPRITGIMNNRRIIHKKDLVKKTKLIESHAQLQTTSEHGGSWGQEESDSDEMENTPTPKKQKRQ